MGLLNVFLLSLALVSMLVLTTVNGQPDWIDEHVSRQLDNCHRTKKG